MLAIDYDYLNELRKNCGLTNQLIAEDSGIPEGTVNRIFSSMPEQPSIVTMACIVHAMGGSLNRLMGINYRECVGNDDECVIINDPDMIAPENRSEVYEYALKASRDSYTHAMDRVSNVYERQIETKNKWINMEYHIIRMLLGICLVLAVAMGIAFAIK